jgi:Tol biopolymer transport system component
VAAAIATFLVLKNNVAGMATLGAGTSVSSPAGSSPATGTADSSTAAVSSSAPTSSSAATTTPGPVPGLPQSTPLPEEVLLGSRAVDGSTNLYQMNGDTGSLGTALTTGAPGVQFPILSPDRGSVVYVQNTPTGNTLRTMAVDGTGDRLLFDAWPAGCTNIYRPAWNPVEQTQLALVCVTAAGNTEVHIVSLDGTDLGIIDTGFPVVDDLTYSPDGKTLAFWGSEAQGSEGSIYTKPLDGSAPAKRVTKAVDGTADADPSWSPDGSKIAFRRFVGDGSSPDSSAQLYVINADGTGLIQITEGPSIDQDPIWSPDGTQIAFKSNRQDAQGKAENQIWVIDAEGGELKEIGAGNPGTADGAPAWGHR